MYDSGLGKEHPKSQNYSGKRPEPIAANRNSNTLAGASKPAIMIKGGNLTDNLTEFVAELNRKIEESGMSNTEIARICGVDIAYISRIRSGKQIPTSWQLLFDLKKLLKIRL